ncbi:hypothetical protein BTUL_0001g01920 [Botrytis tulipae]|uniref:Uncharacterized protein n=1 Tax=Botrytis tulipae TaxID=87230 RepID=A0A4Z1F9B8_9HELO|nr:hypothetical protein BTUL_0001g01920 [Botrytis tulipae]
MSQSSTQIVSTSSISQGKMRFNRNAMENIPQELFERIWEKADTGLGRNVPVCCRLVGNSFEIFSTEARSNITALSVHRRSRQWANTENNVARLLRKGGHKGPHTQVKSLYLDPRPIGVERIAVSDCSHTLGIDNNARGPWASFYWWSSIDNWSSTFIETLMYTTKIDLDVHQGIKFVDWNGAAVTLGHREKLTREGQRLKTRLATRKLQVAEKKQNAADDVAKSGELPRTKQDGVPTWLFEVGRTRRDFHLMPMVEILAEDHKNSIRINERTAFKTNADTYPKSRDNEQPDDAQNGSGGDGNSGDENDGDSDKDEDEEPEPDEGIED